MCARSALKMERPRRTRRTMAMPTSRMGTARTKRGAVRPSSSGRFLAPHGAKAAQKKAESQAAAVAKKDAGRVKVIAEKPEQGAGERHDHEGHGEVVREQRRAGHGKRGKQAYAGRESVDSIDKVDRIGAKHDPKDGDQKADRADKGMTGKSAYANAAAPGVDCRRNLCR